MNWKRLPQLSKNPHNAQTSVQRFLMGDIHSLRGNYTQWSIHTTGVTIPCGYGDQNLNKQNEALQSDCIVQSREEIWGHCGPCAKGVDMGTLWAMCQVWGHCGPCLRGVDGEKFRISAVTGWHDKPVYWSLWLKKAANILLLIILPNDDDWFCHTFTFSHQWSSEHTLNT